MTLVAKVRMLEPIPYEHEGRQMVLLRDPFHFSPEGLSVTVPIYMLMTFMDGEQTADDIAAAFNKRFGAEIKPEEIEKLVAEIDEAGLLETPKFEALRDAALSEFDKEPVRKAALAGSAYEADPDKLRAQIDGFYEQMRRERGETDDGLDGLEVLGIVAPHIDPAVGGPCMGRAFDALKRSPGEPPDLIVLFGTAHGAGDSLFIVTEKHFETPLGTTQTDTEIARALIEGCGVDLKSEEYLHKHEHSIEFPIVFLQHLYGADKFKIVPILVGSFQEFIESNEFPGDSPVMRNFTQTLRDALDASGRRVRYVAGADLSHMGKKFGDAESPNEGFIEAIRRQDHEMLRHIEDGRRDDFFQHLQSTNDRQKVCGLPPIYAMMQTMGDGIKAKLLHYDLNIEEATQSFVTYAGMAFFEE